jgi:fructan beta-fructosidase
MNRPLSITLAAGALAASSALAAFAVPASAGPSSTEAPTFAEPYRPQFHFAPEKNWMNDPNGLVYHQGEYHLFYQHNPNGSSWGDMSWGHAVSEDLVHWDELPLAISHDDEEMVFSGSVVVDHQNTTGFGTLANPPMVAVYTSNPKDVADQNQSLAYSLDRGRTWTKYDGNPVLDIDDNEFRDPKVQWYAPTQSWLMTVVKATQRKVAFYSSPDLKTWEHLSDFGPQGAVGGVWECPDLFPLPVDGSKKRKWVLLVSLNPGHLYGGSGTQYFVGEFDGTTFTPDDDGSYEPPAELSVLEDFESESFDDWTATGTAFGPGPATGAAAGTDQGGVSNYVGERLANSFHGFDGSTGTLTSPSFTVEDDFLNFRIGGGNHPHNPDEVLDPPAPVASSMIADFEGGSYGEGWTIDGNAFGASPSTGTIGDQQPVTGFEGSGLVNTFIDHDAAVGTLTSPEFEITDDYVNFLIGGGRHPMSEPAPTAVNLLVGGEVVRTATGKDAERLTWSAWDVTDLRGQTARLQVVDHNTGGWGHINLDSVMLSDQPAQPASVETTVNLVVDGEIVDSETGPDSERLDWASFDLRRYQGRQARVLLIDANGGGWGHVLADHFTFSDEPALSVAERADWVDFGKDNYAGITWDDVPTGERLTIGWMSNWQYAGSTPTSPWRGAMTAPRQLALRTIDGEVRLTQQPVASLRSLRQGDAVTLNKLTIPEGSTVLAGGSGDGKALEPRGGTVRIRILLDWSSVEVFGGAGEAVITDLIFPDPGSEGVELVAEGGTARLEKLTLRHLGSYRD